MRDCVWSKANVTLLAPQPIDLPPFCITSIGPAIPEIQLLKDVLENLWSKPCSRSYSMVTFESWSSIDMFALSFHCNGAIFGWDIEKPILIDMWRFKVAVMAKVKPWWSHLRPGFNFNRYVCFSFRGNRIILDWDIANSTFGVGNWRSWSWTSSNPMITFKAWCSIDIFVFRFVAIGIDVAEV